MGAETELVLLIAAFLLIVGFCAGWAVRAAAGRTMRGLGEGIAPLTWDDNAREDARARTGAVGRRVDA
jgi:hypothetical protein